jgi:hypothetical protein
MAGRSLSVWRDSARGTLCLRVELPLDVAKTYIEGGNAEVGSAFSSTADRYQLVLHGDEAALHGGVGRADAPLETMRRLAATSVSSS